MGWNRGKSLEEMLIELGIMVSILVVGYGLKKIREKISNKAN